MFSILRSNRRLFSTLLVAESRHGLLHPGNRSALAAAQKLGKPIDVLVLDSEVAAVPLKAEHVQSIFAAKHASFKDPTADVFSHAVNAFIHSQKKYTHVVTMTSNWSKDFFPRVAAVNDCQPVTDVIEIVNDTTYNRPIYAGNAITTVKSPGPLHFLSVRTTSFDPITKTESGEATSIDAADLLKGLPQNVAIWVEDKLKKSERPELGLAKIVVSGGRGSQT